MATRENTVYYWIGGREQGHWNEVLSLTGGSIGETITKLNRSGYVALRGCTNDGPPEGPPSGAKFLAIDM